MLLAVPPARSRPDSPSTPPPPPTLSNLPVQPIILLRTACLPSHHRTAWDSILAHIPQCSPHPDPTPALSPWPARVHLWATVVGIACDHSLASFPAFKPWRTAQVTA
jgi:hypothetical protein